MKLHPIKNIPAPLEHKPVLPRVTLLDVILAYATAILALLGAGVITIFYGGLLGAIASVLHIDKIVLQGLQELGVKTTAQNLVYIGSFIGFAGFCLSLPRISRR